jgi:hypothetical protein
MAPTGPAADPPPTTHATSKQGNNIHPSGLYPERPSKDMCGVCNHHPSTPFVRSRGKAWGVRCDLRSRRVSPATHPLPPLLLQLVERMQQHAPLRSFCPNEANAIDYRQGVHSLGPHVDDRQLSTDVICTLSLAGRAVMTFSRCKGPEHQVGAREEAGTGSVGHVETEGWTEGLELGLGWGAWVGGWWSWLHGCRGSNCHAAMIPHNQQEGVYTSCSLQQPPAVQVFTCVTYMLSTVVQTVSAGPTSYKHLNYCHYSPTFCLRWCRRYGSCCHAVVCKC